MDQVLMTGTAERRRRYREPLTNHCGPLLLVKMNRAAPNSQAIEPSSPLSLRYSSKEHNIKMPTLPSPGRDNNKSATGKVPSHSVPNCRDRSRKVERRRCWDCRVKMDCYFSTRLSYYIRMEFIRHNIFPDDFSYTNARYIQILELSYEFRKH